MAGVKGRSGGARPNSGGARPGAGRKPKPKETPTAIDATDRDMLKLLQDVALGIIDATPIQVRAAIAAVQYTHAKLGEGGKKEERAQAAKKASGGKFSAAAPPKLVVNNR